MIKPGDAYVARPNYVVEHKNLLIVSIDRGELSLCHGARDGRPASITFLVDGPLLIQREFNFLNSYIKITDDRAFGCK